MTAFLKKYHAALIFHAGALLLIYASLRFGIEPDGNAQAFALLFMAAGLLAFDFVSAIIAAAISARAKEKGRTEPPHFYFFYGNFLILLVLLALFLISLLAIY